MQRYPRHTHACGHGGNGALHPLQRIQELHPSPHPVHERGARHGVSMRQDNDELVPAVPRDHSVFPERLAENLRGSLDHLVALGMPVGLVDLPEMVKVHHHQGQRLRFLPGLRHIGAQGVLQEAPVVDTGELVGDRPLSRPLAPLDHLGDELAGAAQPLRSDVEHAVHELQRDGGVLRDDIGKRVLGETGKDARLQGPAGRGAGGVVKDGHLRIARAHGPRRPGDGCSPRQSPSPGCRGPCPRLLRER